MCSTDEGNVAFVSVSLVLSTDMHYSVLLCMVLILIQHEQKLKKISKNFVWMHFYNFSGFCPTKCFDDRNFDSLTCLWLPSELIFVKFCTMIVSIFSMTKYPALNIFFIDLFFSLNHIKYTCHT